VLVAGSVCIAQSWVHYLSGLYHMSHVRSLHSFDFEGAQTLCIKATVLALFMLVVKYCKSIADALDL
jgi:hypothetical protein